MHQNNNVVLRIRAHHKIRHICGIFRTLNIYLIFKYILVSTQKKHILCTTPCFYTRNSHNRFIAAVLLKLLITCTSGFSFFRPGEFHCCLLPCAPLILLLTAVLIDNFSVGPGRCPPIPPWKSATDHMYIFFSKIVKISKRDQI
jgi:hypothetical protein